MALEDILAECCGEIDDQNAVRLILEGIVEVINAIGGGGTSPTYDNSIITTTTETGAFTIPIDAVSISVVNVGNLPGVFDGQPLASGEHADFRAEFDPVANEYNRLPELSGDATGTNIRVRVQR